MKSLLLAMLVGLMMVGCGEEAQKEAVQEEAPKEASFAIKPGENFTVPDLNLTMIWVKPGTLMMEHIGMQHQVTLTKGFYLGKHEVTQYPPFAPGSTAIKISCLTDAINKTLPSARKSFG
mgnify:CR=1 FL=1